MTHQRVTVHFTGTVQGVGFRYATQRLAEGHPVSGFVQNLKDGRVLLVIEGTAEDTRVFLEALVDQMRQFIRDHQVKFGEATGEFGRPGVDSLRVKR